jgi:ATP-dependent helicase HrpA
VIASALSVQDVRDRPMEAQQQADQQHAKFDDEKSEFSGYLRCGSGCNDARGGGMANSPRKEMAATRPREEAGNLAALAGVFAWRSASGASVCSQYEHASGCAQPTHKLSNRQYEQLLRQNFINVRRVREWRDIHSQLLTVVAEHKWQLNTQPASYERCTCPCWPACWATSASSPTSHDGVPGRARHQVPPPPRRAPAQKARALDRLRRTGGNHAPVWPGHCQHRAAVAGRSGRRTCSKSSCSTRTGRKKRRGDGLERATLYGLVVYSGRRVSFGKVDPHAAREMFIRQALVAAMAARVGQAPAVPGRQRQAHRQGGRAGAQVAPPGRAGGRRADLRLLRPAGAAGRVQRPQFRALVPRAPAKRSPICCKLTRDELMRHEAAGITTSAFPKMVAWAAWTAPPATCTSPATRATA